MEDIKESCKWNSRYWEQRALLMSDKDINCAINYAETAVSIEEHPYTFTTMSKILFKKMCSEEDGESIYTTCIESLKYAIRAMKEEEVRHMESVTPIFVIIDGLIKYYGMPNKRDLDKKISDTVFAALETYKDMLRFSDSEISRIETVQNYLR